MCGISGFIDLKNKISISKKKKISKKLNKINSRRGPDGDGIWFSSDYSVCFCHTRLSIIDLSNMGSQPMLSQNGRFIITYNGEIYNYRELRKKHEIKTNGNSDTELLVELINLYGLEKTLDMIDGMYAFALWDKKLKKFYIIRDRFGIKPLYWSKKDGIIVFSSDLRVFRELYTNLDVSIDSLKNFLIHSYIPAPLSILKDVYKVLPGELIIFDKQKIMKKSYWNYEKKSNKIILPENEYREGLEQKISEVVKSHMVSDREISCFLSGGVDSSLISLMTQKNSQKKIKTYTVGFNDRNFDEAKHAKEISKYIQSDHHEIYLNSKDMLDTIYTLGEIYDEPFADSSQVPTSIICKWISNYHKVVLSGDGGDELFLGYNRYAYANKINNILSLFPSFSKKLLSYLLSWTISFNKVFNDNYSNIRFEKLKRLIELKGDENLKFNIYKLLVSYMLDPTKFLIDKSQTNFEIDKQIKNFRDNSFKTSMQNTDLSFYLPNDILNKVDRASMYFGLEVRVPFLDRRLFEFITMYQTKFHEKKFTKKIILKEILYKTIPRNLIDRPKHGFAVPLKKWISKDLNKYIKKMILDNLDEQTFDKQQILNLFKNNTYYNASIIWNILMFCIWKKSYFKKI